MPWPPAVCFAAHEQDAGAADAHLVVQREAIGCAGVDGGCRGDCVAQHVQGAKVGLRVFAALGPSVARFGASGLNKGGARVVEASRSAWPCQAGVTATWPHGAPREGACELDAGVHGGSIRVMWRLNSFDVVAQSRLTMHAVMGGLCGARTFLSQVLTQPPTSISPPYCSLTTSHPMLKHTRVGNNFHSVLLHLHNPRPASPPTCTISQSIPSTSPRHLVLVRRLDPEPPANNQKWQRANHDARVVHVGRLNRHRVREAEEDNGKGKPANGDNVDDEAQTAHVKGALVHVAPARQQVGQDGDVVGNVIDRDGRPQHGVESRRAAQVETSQRCICCCHEQLRVEWDAKPRADACPCR